MVSQEAADQIAQQTASLPIDIVDVSDDLTLVKQAAVFKATHKMSYADCFVAALAKQQSAELVTGDSEFEAVEKEIRIQWLGPNPRPRRQVG